MQKLRKRTGQIGGILVALTLVGTGCSSEPKQETVTLKGHVVDPSGAPLAGIEVGYYKKGVFASDSAATTESDGAWEFEVPKAFMAPPAGRVFFQHLLKEWSMAMHRGDSIPEPVVLKKAPPKEEVEESTSESQSSQEGTPEPAK